MNTGSSSNRRHPRQAGFSMVELLMTAFILAIGLLGLTMLQTLALRSTTGSRSLNTAVAVGEGILESIQSEGRQRMLFLKYAGTQPTTTYFGGTDPEDEYYDFNGAKVANAASAYYTVSIKSTVVVAKSATAGGTKKFVLVITFQENAGSNGFRTRTATLTRQVAYA